MGPVTGVRLSLWRAAVVFRVVAAVFDLFLIVKWHGLYARPAIAWIAAGGIVVVTALVAGVGGRGYGARIWFVAADLVVTIGLTVLSIPAQTHAQAHGNMPTLTTVWAAGPVIEAGLLLGSLGGIVAALAQFASTVAVRAGYDGHTIGNGVLLLIVGGISGYVLAWTVQAEEEREQLATLAERDRLARSIHDGVLQVLALVHRKATEAGGEWAELGQAAAEQEAALRGLITSRRRHDTDAGDRDLAVELTRFRSATVTVSVPAHPIPLPAGDAEELLASIEAALHNVSQHAGPQALAWVFAEQLETTLLITVRDDGRGMAAGTLEQAAANGRIGVASSIRGRIEDLGGRTRIVSSPDAGTEIELELPYRTRRKS